MRRQPKVYRMSHHQNKENAFQKALAFRGWSESRYIYSQFVRFGLFDADWRPVDIERLNGMPYFLYPHAARPMVQYDGCVKPRTDCRTMFVSAPGGVYLMEKIGYPCEVVEVGWSLTPIRKFRPRKAAEKITFAPIHPNHNGYLNDIDPVKARDRSRSFLIQWTLTISAPIIMKKYYTIIHLIKIQTNIWAVLSHRLKIRQFSIKIRNIWRSSDYDQW